MAGVSTDSSSLATGNIDALLDALLYSVSHDLKSPLLTLSLSADLLVQASPELEESARVALDGLRHGAKDMERMLDALTAVSRARRRPLESAGAHLGEALRGHDVRGDRDGLDRPVAAVDPRLLTELLATLFGDGGGEVALTVSGGEATLTAAAPADCADVEGSPLAALFGSLTSHAGSAVESLAVIEVQLARQGATLALAGGQALVRLPLAAGR